MKTFDRYLRYVLWSEEDACYVGYCPDVFPAGGVCHADTEEDAYAQLCALIREEILALGQTGALPQVQTRPMREVLVA